MKSPTSLQTHGYRITRTRKAVLNTLSKKPSTAQEIYAKIKKSQGIDLASVYRTLKILSTLGIIHIVNTGDGTLRYEQANQAHHHHLICKRCGTIADTTICDDLLVKKASAESSFTITDHRLEFYGFCRNCHN